MKKFVLTITFIGMLFGISFAQNQQEPREVIMFSDEYFNGMLHYDYNVKYDLDAQQIIDLAVAEDTTGELKKNPIALGIVKAMWKNKIKKLKELMYVSELPEGQYDAYQYVDMDNYRTISLLPFIGRVLIIDYKKGVQYVAYPKLNIVMKTEFPSSEEMITTQKEAYQRTPVFDFQKIQDVNGYKTVNVLGFLNLVKHPEAIKQSQDTITINGTLYGTVDGHNKMVADYQRGIMAMGDWGDGKISSQETELLEMKEHKIDSKNFEIPSNLTITENAKKFNKTILKAVKKDKSAMAVQVDGDLPANIWDLFK